MPRTAMNRKGQKRYVGNLFSGRVYLIVSVSRRAPCADYAQLAYLIGWRKGEVKTLSAANWTSAAGGR
jgi:hypothetical protein